MQESITYVGLDVHRDTITAAAVVGLAPASTEMKTMPTDLGRLVR
jgi:hypothetical protein